MYLLKKNVYFVFSYEMFNKNKIGDNLFRFVFYFLNIQIT
ncbi:hypothetical protein SAMN05444337_1894 [Flavobacterium haoranii]|uniref:Uncharacterized protein n=1 Tax=Flavobacterium haoranii TaxID=683124 RepID=A0A1M6IWL4_9FLAO|nr:hypothetical protein SAMN05444337_1894 [Flavobacterium haoranii]